MLKGEHLAILSYHLSLRYLFCLFLSGRFTQVLLYVAEPLINPMLSFFSEGRDLNAGLNLSLEKPIPFVY